MKTSRKELLTRPWRNSTTVATGKQTLVDSSTFASGENGAPTIRESPILDTMEEFLSPVLQRKRDPKVLMIPRLMVPRLSRSRLRLRLLPKKLQRHEELEPEEGVRSLRRRSLSERDQEPESPEAKPSSINTMQFQGVR